MSLIIMNENTKGIIFILISTLMFGSYGVWSKLIGDGFGNFYQGWTRALMITVVLFPILYYTKQIVPIYKKDWKWFGVFLLFTSGTQAPIFYAFNNMDIGSATLLFFVSMLLTMYLFGIFFLEEKLNKIKISSFLIAIIGLVITFKLSLVSFALIAIAMAVLNGVASGVEVASSKKLTGNYSALYVSWLSWIIILITNAPLSLLLKEVQHFPSLSVIWFWQLCYALASLFGFYLMIRGLKYIEASTGGLLALLEVVFGITFGILFFQEALTPQVLIGGILILIAAALPHFKKETK